MKRVWVWAVIAAVIASGATWLAAFVWQTSELAGQAYGPQLAGALATGLTLARVSPSPRRRTTIALAVGGVLAWIALQLAACLARGAPPHWMATFDTSPLAHYAVVALLAAPVAGAAASLRFRAGERHRVAWLWTASLVMLGTMITVLVIATGDRLLSAPAAILLACSPLLAGALTQLVAPYRMIWTCGGGAAVFALIGLEQAIRRGESEVAGPLLGVGVFILVGALGARIAWRLFRHRDPRTPAASQLPAATTQ